MQVGRERKEPRIGPSVRVCTYVLHDEFAGFLVVNQRALGLFSPPPPAQSPCSRTLVAVGRKNYIIIIIIIIVYGFTMRLPCARTRKRN